MKTHELLGFLIKFFHHLIFFPKKKVRKWKIPSKVKESKWDYEIGDEPKK